MKPILTLALIATLLTGCSTINGWLGKNDGDSSASDSADAAPASPAGVDMNNPQQAADAFMQMIGRDFLPTCNVEPYFAFVAYPEGISEEKIAAGKKRLKDTCLGLENREENARKTLEMRAHGMKEAQTPGTILVLYTNGQGEEQVYPFTQTGSGWKYPFPFDDQ